MSVGSWEPPGSTAPVKAELLDIFIEYSRSQKLEQLEKKLSAAERSALPALMQLDPEHWVELSASRSDGELLHLIRFFTMAENLSGCEANDKSPVIPISRLLRRRGYRLDKELLLWIRDVNKNRFLPYGAL